MKKRFLFFVVMMVPFTAWAQQSLSPDGSEGAVKGAANVRQLKSELQISRESYDHLKALYLQKEAESRMLSEKIAGFSREFGDLQQLIERLKREKETLEAGQSAMVRRLKEFENRKEPGNGQEKAVEDARKRLNQVTEKLAKAEADKLGILSEVDKLRKQADKSAELEKALAEIRSLKDELKKRAVPAGNNEASAGEQEKLRLQINALTEQLRENQGRVTAQVKAEDEAVVRALNDRIALLEKNLKETQDFNYQLVQEKAGFQSGEKDLKGRLKEFDEQKLTLEQLNKSLAARNQSFEKEYAKLSEQFARLQVQSTEFERQKQALADQLDGRQKELSGVSQKLAAAEGNRQQLLSQLESVNKEKEDIAARLARETSQHEEEVSLMKAGYEQELAQKEGSILRLAAKIDEFKAARQTEAGVLAQKLEAAQKELNGQKELSFRLVQDKAAMESRQTEQGQKLSELEKQKLMFQQERDKLAEQNTFLKNQYISISQEVNNLREQYSRSQGKPAAAPSKNAQAREKELIAARKEMAAKVQEYSAKLKEYEEKLKTKEELERQNRLLSDDFSRLKEAYMRLEQKYGEAEDVAQRHEILKDKYAGLPQENTTLHYNLGVLYAQNQEYDKAVVEFEKVLVLKPDDTETLYNLGVIYGEHLKDAKKAISHFKRYLSLAPDDADAQRVRKYILTWETYGQEIKDGK